MTFNGAVLAGTATSKRYTALAKALPTTTPFPRLGHALSGQEHALVRVEVTNRGLSCSPRQQIHLTSSGLEAD
jgi:hypothetical protein